MFAHYKIIKEATPFSGGASLWFPTRWAKILILCVSLELQYLLVQAASASIQTIHEEPANENEDPKNYLQIILNGKIYRSAILGNWKLIENFSGMDFAAIPPEDRPGMVGIKIETYLDQHGKPYSHFTQELIERQLKRLKMDEKDGPIPKETGTILELNYTRTEGNQIWKYRYQLWLVGDQLWTFICKATPSTYDETSQIFGILTGTFAKKAEE